MLPTNSYYHCFSGFFSQFGKVKNLRVSRNKKTGKSKHYAFIEFHYPEVAQIAAESMNNYLMFGQILVTKVLKPSQVHPDTFKGANRTFKRIPWQKLARQGHNK